MSVSCFLSWLFGYSVPLANSLPTQTSVLLRLLLQANLKVPLPFASRQGRSGVGEYLLSFLDENMLIGRAQNGTFVFVREQ
jgi:hypothetical protein